MILIVVRSVKTAVIKIYFHNILLYSSQYLISFCFSFSKGNLLKTISSALVYIPFGIWTAIGFLFSSTTIFLWISNMISLLIFFSWYLSYNIYFYLYSMIAGILSYDIVDVKQKSAGFMLKIWQYSYIKCKNLDWIMISFLKLILLMICLELVHTVPALCLFFSISRCALQEITC